MPRLVSRLFDTDCRKAKPKDRDYKLYDEGNLRLLVRKSGTKVWQYPYKLHGKENIYTIGQYPVIGLSDARRIRDEAKAAVAQGLSPNREKAAQKAQTAANSENSFEAIAREWHSKQVWDAKHTKVVLRSLENNAFPYIGALPIHKVTAHDILYMLRKMEERNALDIARRVNQRCADVFEYAIGLKLCDLNPALGRSKTIKSVERKHRPHLYPKYIPEFLTGLETYRGSTKVKLAMQLLWLTFVRPGELRNAKWEDFDEEKALWRIPAEQMKMKRPHLVPLSIQALQILKQLKPITGRTKFLFPGEKNTTKPISDVALLKVLIILGFHKDSHKQKLNKEQLEAIKQTGRTFVPHGIRGTASTILNEDGKYKPDVIERQLAHIERNSVRAAYNHAEYLDERTEMMQWWADYLDKAKACIQTHE
ncbi:MAG TPA: tyrosine-type recombinase/integrase [Daejeonella sp.]